MKRSKKSQKIILTVVITLLVIAGLFILRAYLYNKFGLSILARTTQAEQILMSKVVANGDFSRDVLTNLEIVGNSIELKGNETTGMIQGNFTLPQTASVTKLTAGVSGFDTTCTKIGIEAEFSTDATSWSQRYVSNISSTLALPSPVNAKYAIYKITLSSCNTTDTPQLYNLTLLGYTTVRADLAATQAQCEAAGGTWKTDFPNTCRNECSYVRNPGGVSCGAAISAGCLCPSQQCWESTLNDCVDIATSVPTPPEPNVCELYGGTYGSDCIHFCDHKEPTCGFGKDGCECKEGECWEEGKGCIPYPPIPGGEEEVSPPPVPGMDESVSPPPVPGFEKTPTITPPTPKTITVTATYTSTTTSTSTITSTATPYVATPTPTPAPTATYITGVFSTPSETIISGIQSGTSFYLIITAVVLIGGFVVYRIVISKEE